VALVALQNGIGAVQLSGICMYLAIISLEWARRWSISVTFPESAGFLSCCERKMLFGEAFSAPINGRDDGRAKSKSRSGRVGTAGGTRHWPGAGSLCVRFLGAKF
jgi:hypothetical protein